MTNSYFERLNTFKTEINTASANARTLKRRYKELQAIHGSTMKSADWSNMIHVLWDLEKNTQVINSLLHDRQVLKEEAADYWSSRKRYNGTTDTRE